MHAPRPYVAVAGVVFFLASCSHAPPRTPADPKLGAAGEPRVAQVRAVTQGTEPSTHPRWSAGGDHLVFTRLDAASGCLRVRVARTDGQELRTLLPQPTPSGAPVATSDGAYLPGGDRTAFSGTDHCLAPVAPAPATAATPGTPVARTLETGLFLYSVKTDGTDPLPMEPGAPRSYTAEIATCRDGTVLFSSDRDGDLELYRGKLDHLNTLTEVKRLTNAPGSDHSPALSPDCRRIAWLAARPKDEAEKADMEARGKKHETVVSDRELWVADADGAHGHQVTRGAQPDGSAPAFLPDGHGLLYAGRDGNLHSIGFDGTHAERVTAFGAAGAGGAHDSEPAFSPDGKTLAFSTQRGGAGTQIALADWAALPAPGVPLTVSDPDAANRLAALATQAGAPETWLPEALKAAGLAPHFKGGYAERVQVVDRGRVSAANNYAGTLGSGCGRTSVAPTLLEARLGRAGSWEAATLLETARALAADLAAAKPDARACYVFAWLADPTPFVAELAGSGKDHRPRAVVGLGRVERLENNHLTASGGESSADWVSALAAACGTERLLCDGGDGSAEAGDARAFYDQLKVPVLALSTAGPATPSLPGEANVTGALQIAHTAAALARQAASPRTRLRYQKAVSGPLTGVPATAPEPHGFGAYLGIIPDYRVISSGAASASDPNAGMRIAGVRNGSPAARAGLRDGDVVQSIATPRGKHPVRLIEDFMGAMADLHPGEAATFQLRRGEEALNATLTPVTRTR